MPNMKPMLFNTDMVRALLNNRKTVTRRVVKLQPPEGFIQAQDVNGEWFFNDKLRDDDMMAWWPSYEKGIAPPCHHNDTLYVRETWTKLWYVDPDGYTHFEQPMYYYKADGAPDITLYDADGFKEDDQRIRWRPSIHMPREAARIFLRVTDVRMERLQDITEAEILQDTGEVQCTDGYDWFKDEFKVVPYSEKFKFLLRAAWGRYWDEHIVKMKEEYMWDANPWVWVIEFERISKKEAMQYD